MGNTLGVEGQTEQKERTKGEKIAGAAGVIIIVVAVAWFLIGQYAMHIEARTVSDQYGSGHHIVSSTATWRPLSVTALAAPMLVGFLLLTPYFDEVGIAGIANWRRRTERLEQRLSASDLAVLQLAAASAAPAAVAVTQEPNEPEAAQTAEVQLSPEDRLARAEELWTGLLGPAWRLRTYKPEIQAKFSEFLRGGSAAGLPSEAMESLQQLKARGITDAGATARWATERAGVLQVMQTTIDDVRTGRVSEEAAISVAAAAEALSSELEGQAQKRNSAARNGAGCG